MKIEVWSDFVCPFCYIGKRRLEEALKMSPYGDQVTVEYKAYELDPTAPASTDEKYHESLARKYGKSEEEALGMMENMAAQAKTVGLNYNLDALTPANTFKAHRLAKFAKTKGLDIEFTERVLRAYFIEGQKIGLDEVLIPLATEVGLNEAEVKEVLSSNAFEEEVRTDIAEASQVGVRGVPFFVMDRKYAMSGGQPAEVFAQAIEKVAQEAGLQPTLQVLGDEDAGGMCADGKCEI